MAKKAQTPKKGRKKGKKPCVHNMHATTFAQQHACNNVCATTCMQQRLRNNMHATTCTQQHARNKIATTKCTQQHARNKIATTKCTKQCSCNIATTKCTQQHSYLNTAATTCAQQHSALNAFKKSVDKNRGKRIIIFGTWNKIADKSAKSLLNDPDIRRWYENTSRSSKHSGTGRLSRLNLYCYRIGIDAKEYARIGKKNPAKAEDILMDHVSWMEDQKYSPGYIEEMIKAAKSWLIYNRVDIRRKIKVKNASMTTTLHNEMNPTPEQIIEILNAAPPRTRAIVSLMAFSGIRPQVMGLVDGSDGLKLGDLPELKIEGQKISFSVVPAIVIVRANLSKTKNQYATFFPKPGCDAVIGYLRQRMSWGEKLDANSPLIRVANGWETRGINVKREGLFLCTQKISDCVRQVVKNIIKIRPYALRSYFDSQLLIAESHACIPHAYRKFFMGHKGDIEARYTTNKGRLTEQMREDMRRCYTNSQPFLYPHEGGSADKAGVLRDLWRRQAAEQGLDAADIMEVKSDRTEPVSEAKSETVQPKASRPEPIPEAKPESAQLEPSQDVQEKSKNKVISGDDELVKYLDMGWTMIQELANSRYIIRDGMEVRGA